MRRVSRFQFQSDSLLALFGVAQQSPRSEGVFFFFFLSRLLFFISLHTKRRRRLLEISEPRISYKKRHLDTSSLYSVLRATSRRIHYHSTPTPHDSG